MFTVNAEQKSMYGMMNQGMRMDWVGSILVVLAAMALNLTPKQPKKHKVHE